jgi:glutathionylspermidine synthase
VDVQDVVAVDKRLIPAQPPTQDWLKKHQLEWFAKGDNATYLATRIVELSDVEISDFRQTTQSLYSLYLAAARFVDQTDRWENIGIPQAAVKLMRYSLEREKDYHIFGRFDLAGGLDGLPVKLLEFNADTCSLLPETTAILPAMAQPLGRQASKNFPLMEHLVAGFRRLLRQNSHLLPTILFSTMGHPEDELNVAVLLTAAREAGFEVVQHVELQRVIFSADEGIFVELGPDRYQQYGFWAKMVPWDFICYDEPDLLDLLQDIIMGGHAVVINPAFTMMLQSKGMLAILAELNPDHAALLNASLEEDAISEAGAYVSKPIFGRFSENITLTDEHGKTIATSDGDYGDFPYVYQSMAEFNEDSRGYRYQPSVFWAQQPGTLCFRRQQDLLLDDDAEFVGAIVGV